MAQHLKNWAGPGSSGHYWSITTTYRALQKLSEENSKATSAAKLTAWHNRALLAQLPPKSFLGRAASCLHGKSIGSSAAERRRKSSSRASQNGSCVGDNQLTVVADNFSGDGGDAGDDLAGVTILFGPRGASESAVKAFSQQILSASAAFLLLLCCFYAAAFMLLLLLLLLRQVRFIFPLLFSACDNIALCERMYCRKSVEKVGKSAV